MKPSHHAKIRNGFLLIALAITITVVAIESWPTIWTTRVPIRTLDGSAKLSALSAPAGLQLPLPDAPAVSYGWAVYDRWGEKNLRSATLWDQEGWKVLHVFRTDEGGVAQHWNTDGVPESANRTPLRTTFDRIRSIEGRSMLSVRPRRSTPRSSRSRTRPGSGRTCLPKSEQQRKILADAQGQLDPAFDHPVK